MFLFLFALSSFAALGVRCESDCNTPPACTKSLNFVRDKYKLEQALGQIGDGLPSDGFFKQNCKYLVEFLNCYRQGCGLRHIIIDLDDALITAVEFCKEESALRKAYVDNVECFNRIEINEQTCVSSILRTTKLEMFNSDMSESLQENTMDRLCLLFHFFMTCAVDVATDTCGKNAGQAAAAILNRALDIIICTPNEMDIFSSISGFLEAAESFGQCNASTVTCTGAEEVMEIIGAQYTFPTEGVLLQHCRMFKETLKCPVEQAEVCDESTDMGSVAAYEEFLEVVDNICEEDSPLRASYLRSVSCYNGILDKLSSCTYAAKDAVNSFMLSEINSPLPFGTKAPLKYTCMTGDLIPNCQLSKVVESCGAEAAKTLGKVLISLQRLSLSTHCKETHMAIWRDEFLTFLTNAHQSECEK